MQEPGGNRGWFREGFQPSVTDRLEAISSSSPNSKLAKLARRALFGTLSESYGTCGKPGCRCRDGEKHGPHLDVSFRGKDGKTTGYYGPQVLAEDVRAGVAAWHDLQELLRELAEANRERLWESRSSREDADRG